MTQQQRELARHALGLERRHPASYRNRFVTGRGSKDHREWMEMVATGDAVRRAANVEFFGDDDLFCMTLRGAESVLEPGESLDMADFQAVTP